MMGLYVSVAYLDVTDPEHRCNLGEDPMCETRHDTPGQLFRALAGRDKSHPWESLGRCTGKVYVDGPDGQPEQVGWIFVQRVPYDNERRYDVGEPDTYLREAWVTVHSAPDTVTRTPHYVKLGGGPA